LICLNSVEICAVYNIWNMLRKCNFVIVFFPWATPTCRRTEITWCSTELKILIKYCARMLVEIRDGTRTGRDLGSDTYLCSRRWRIFEKEASLHLLVQCTAHETKYGPKLRRLHYNFPTETKKDIFYIPLTFLFHNNKIPWLLEKANYSKEQEL
jgi:hypothetical protein